MVSKNSIIEMPRVYLLFSAPLPIFSDIRKYSATGETALVFIFTDSAAGEHSLYKMFPKTVLTELHIYNIR